MRYRALLLSFACAALFSLCLPLDTHASTLSKPSNNVGLVGYWPLDEGTGSVAGDYSGRKNAGALTGSPAWVAGKFGRALQFTSAGQYITTGYTVPAQSSATSFTWSAWINQTTSGGTQVILGFRNGATWAKLTPSSFEYSAGGIIANTLPTGRWTLVTIVKSGSNFTYYEDGAVIGTATNAGSAVSHTFFIGSDPGFSDGTPHYSIDDVRVYERALSATEVSNLYILGGAKINKTFTAVSGGLAGWFTMDGADTVWTSLSAATAADKSGTGNTMTLTNMSESSAPVPGKIGQALKFDGVDDYLRRPTLVASLGTQTTVCMWIKAANRGQDQVLWTIDRNSGSILNEAVFKILANGQLRYWDYNGSAYGFADNTPDSSAVVADNTWHQVCFTKDGTAGTFYVDGVSSGTKTAALSVSYGTTDMIVGEDFRDGSAFFKGLIDDVRVYTRALSASEIKQVYNEGAGTKVNVDTANAGSSLASGLLAYWSFNGADVTDKIYDRAGGNNAYVGGGVATSSMKTIGKVGQALQFDGLTTYAVAPVGPDPVASYSVSVWVKDANPSDATSKDIIAFTDASSNHAFLMEIGNSASNLIRFLHRVPFGGSGGDSFYSNTAITTSNWYHIVFTRDSATKLMSIYVNGVLDNTLTGSGDDFGTASLVTTMGRLTQSTNARYWNGSIDEVRVYNRVLSAAEVQQLYLAGK